MKAMSRWHPAAVLCYGGGVLLAAVFFTDPVVALLTLLGGVAAVLTGTDRPRGKEWLGYTGLCLLVAVTNPLFVPLGDTVLFTLFDRPYTAEALLYGAVLGASLLGALLWFRALGSALSEEGLLSVFGKVLPRTGLVITMVLRLVPRLRREARQIYRARRAMGLSRLPRTEWLRAAGALIGETMENAVDTATSMRARGYGAPGRTAYRSRQFTRWDGLRLSVCLLLAALLPTARLCGWTVVYYPAVTGVADGPLTVIAYVAYAILISIPLIAEGKEAVQWMRYRSNISHSPMPEQTPRR